MSNDIVKRQTTAPATNQALSLASMTPHEAWKFADALAGSGMLPRQYQGNPASVLWALEYGRAIGLDVITTTQSVHVIQGRATASADLMASLTRRAGHRMRISGDDNHAEVTIFRADDPEFAFTAVWDRAKAERAKLLKKDTWQQFPGAMLRARAISECVRMACPEVLHGSIYTPEELGARVDADGSPMDATVQQLRAAPADNDQWATPAAAPAPEWVETVVSLTEKAEQATDPAIVRDLWRQGKDAGLLKAVTLTPLGSMELGAYLVARGKELAAPADDQQPAEVVEGEVVGTAEEEAQAAEAELRAFAEQAGITGIDSAFELAKGVPLTEATAEQITSLLTELRGNAA